MSDTDVYLAPLAEVAAAAERTLRDEPGSRSSEEILLAQFALAVVDALHEHHQVAVGHAQSILGGIDRFMAPVVPLARGEYRIASSGAERVDPLDPTEITREDSPRSRLRGRRRK